MKRSPWLTHTHWTWKPADPVRHIYLHQHRETRVWKVWVSDAGTPWGKDFEEFSAAMRVIARMIENTGGPAKWLRRGPEFNGNKFS